MADGYTYAAALSAGTSAAATTHWRAAGQPIIQSFEPGEDWFWNYDTDEYYDGRELAPLSCNVAASNLAPRPRLLTRFG